MSDKTSNGILKLTIDINFGTLFFPLGVILAGGLAYYFLTKPGQEEDNSHESAQNLLNEQSSKSKVNFR